MDKSLEQILRNKIQVTTEDLVSRAAFAGCVVVIEPKFPDAPKFYKPVSDEDTGGVTFFAQENMVIQGTASGVARIPLGIKIRVYGNSQFLITEHNNNEGHPILPKIITPFSSGNEEVFVKILPLMLGASLNVREGQALCTGTAIAQLPIFLMVNRNHDGEEVESNE